MNKETKDVFFKLSTKIDESNHRIEEIANLCIHNNIQVGTRLDQKAEKTEVDGLIIEIKKLIGLFEAFESIIHKGVKH